MTGGRLAERPVQAHGHDERPGVAVVGDGDLLEVGGRGRLVGGIGLHGRPHLGLGRRRHGRRDERDDRREGRP